MVSFRLLNFIFLLFQVLLLELSLLSSLTGYQKLGLGSGKHKFQLGLARPSPPFYYTMRVGVEFYFLQKIKMKDYQEFGL